TVGVAISSNGGMDVTNGVIGDLLRHRVRLSPDLEAVVTRTKRLTFREYNETVNRVAHFLLQNNIQKGDRVAILCKNLHPLPVIYLAAAKIGAVAVPINWRQKTEDRKSTRLNSSHVKISYAVFCLKK